MTTVLIVDDHPIVRAGLLELLSSTPDIEVVGFAGRGDVAVHLALNLRPEIVLMDIEMPVMDGIEATRAILAEAPDTVVIMLSTFDTVECLDRAVAAGARGFLRKDVPPMALIAGIRTAAAAWVSFIPGLEPALLDGKRPSLLPCS